jgi:hypothetical protein
MPDTADTAIWAPDDQWSYYSKHLEQFTNINEPVYTVIHKSLRDFRLLRYSSRDGHAEGEHVNIGRDTPSFCPALQVLDISTLGDAADVNPVSKFLPHTVNHVA